MDVADFSFVVTPGFPDIYSPALEQQLAALTLSRCSKSSWILLYIEGNSRYCHLREKVMKSVAAVIVRNIGNYISWN